MILIAHRGNTVGKFESYENEPNYIDKAIKEEYDVEIDIWYKDDNLFLGHDVPQYGIPLRWLRDRIGNLWIHCKNIDAMLFFNSCGYIFNYFWHESDTVTLTSKGYIWSYPTPKPYKGSIAVLPELDFYSDVTGCLGICSDVISNYKKS